jgi:hypothetical protein
MGFGQGFPKPQGIARPSSCHSPASFGAYNKIGSICVSAKMLPSLSKKLSLPLLFLNIFTVNASGDNVMESSRCIYSGLTWQASLQQTNEIRNA